MKRIISLLFGFLSLIMTILILVSSSTMGNSEKLNINKVNFHGPITINNWHSDLEIYNNIITWADEREGKSSIYILDINSGIETRITNNTYHHYAPSIYEDKIVYQVHHNGNVDIFLYNLTSNDETQLTYGIGYKAHPIIEQNIIVWDQKTNQSWNIVYHDLNLNVSKPISNDKEWQQWPDIHKNRIVWSDNRNGNWDIFMYDISTEIETQITRNGSDQYLGKIMNDIIVWQDWRNGNSDIYYYDISKDSIVEVTNCPTYQYWPIVSENLIIWEEKRNDDNDLYCYDLKNEKKFPLSNTDSWETEPAIFKNRIIWLEADEKSHEIVITREETFRIFDNKCDDIEVIDTYYQVHRYEDVVTIDIKISGEVKNCEQLHIGFIDTNSIFPNYTRWIKKPYELDGLFTENLSYHYNHFQYQHLSDGIVTYELRILFTINLSYYLYLPGSKDLHYTGTGIEDEFMSEELKYSIKVFHDSKNYTQFDLSTDIDFEYKYNTQSNDSIYEEYRMFFTFAITFLLLLSLMLIMYVIGKITNRR